MRAFILGAALAAAVLAAPGAAEAQTATGYTFTAVDAVRLDATKLYVTGVVEGEAAAREVLFNFSGASSYEYMLSALESCQRYALVAMSKPGQYLLRMQQSSSWASYASCTLARAVP
jgi:hypothetical protein